MKKSESKSEAGDKSRERRSASAWGEGIPRSYFWGGFNPPLKERLEKRGEMEWSWRQIGRVAIAYPAGGAIFMNPTIPVVMEGKAHQPHQKDHQTDEGQTFLHGLFLWGE